MAGAVKKFAMMGVTVSLLAGCADSLWPSLEAGDPAGSAAPTAVAAAPTPVQPIASPVSTAQFANTENTQLAALSVGANSGTFVGDKVSQMQGDLQKLQGNIGGLEGSLNDIRALSQNNAARYHSLLAEITARLQNGTTPGNPELVHRWNDAQVELEAVAQTLPQLTKLSNDAAEEAAFGQFLLNSVQATYGLSGAVESDHQKLRILEDAVHQSVVEVDRLLSDLSQDINRQNTYVNNERQNMTTLSLAVKNGELYGTSLTTRAFTQTEAIARATARSGQPSAQDTPLVVIRFDRQHVNYQQALYNAVSQALERKPGATFDLLAVSPANGNASQVALSAAAARRNAEDVLRTMTDMGIQPSRVQLLSSSDNIGSNEVRLYVR